jgi:cytochrome c peroxidase
VLQGCFVATKNESDKYILRVAPLRNIAKMAPTTPFQRL